MDKLDVDTEMSRTEAAAFFREIADKLEGRWPPTDRADEGAAVVGDEGDRRRRRGDDDREGTATERGGVPTPETERPETMTVIVGGESATVVLPERMAVDVEVGSRSGLLESGVEQHLAFELVWETEEVPEDDSIEVV